MLNTIKNTKYFANIKKRRSEQKTVHILVVNGEDITNRTQILEEQRLFFENLYKRKHVENNTLLKNTHHALNQEEKLLCDGLFNEYECGLALKEMQNNKKPDEEIKQSLFADDATYFLNDISD
ncbi:hypothetical protein DPMN_031523 [Dreissena polymorpha]|uniref:Uncharacterized protein n=1 Tax=Dreissena polymorpha TaxID=45954 RepID=A0A9D4RI46_DREPO|nr:hypothetical protein DPMN_031523 [Dreissena polymorpha]